MACIHENIGVVLVELEVTEGLDPSPLAANAVKVLSMPQFNLNHETAEVTGINGAASVKEHVSGASHWDIVLEFAVKGSGTAGTLPESDPLWQAAGYKAANGASDHVFTPDLSQKKSCTIYWYADGLLYKASGCKGNLSFSGEAGGFLKATWTGKGIYADPTDAAIVSSPVYDATKPIPMINTTFSYGGYSAVLRQLSINSGVSVAALKAASATYGIDAICLDRFNITGQMVIRHALVATRAVEKLTVDGAAGVALSLVLGATAGNIMTITSSGLKKTNAQKQTNGGQIDDAIDFKLSETASLKDDITFTLT